VTKTYEFAIATIKNPNAEVSDVMVSYTYVEDNVEKDFK
jgi:hypothetical protein